MISKLFLYTILLFISARHESLASDYADQVPKMNISKVVSRDLDFASTKYPRRSSVAPKSTKTPKSTKGPKSTKAPKSSKSPKASKIKKASTDKDTEAAPSGIATSDSFAGRANMSFLAAAAASIILCRF